MRFGVDVPASGTGGLLSDVPTGRFVLPRPRILTGGDSSLTAQNYSPGASGGAAPLPVILEIEIVEL
jgi:hypothetical protein